MTNIQKSGRASDALCLNPPTESRRKQTPKMNILLSKDLSKIKHSQNNNADISTSLHFILVCKLLDFSEALE